MRLARHCSLWLLAFAASACVFEYKLGDEGDPDAQPGTGGGSSRAGGAGLSQTGGRNTQTGGGGGVQTAGSNLGGGGTGGTPIADAGIDRGEPDTGVDACSVMVAFYGPQPCQSTTDCVQRHGAGWYCDQSHAFENGCGQRTVWPICKQTIDDGGPKPDADACRPMSTYYGPPPCQDDDDCTKSGTGRWYCDKTNAYEDNCGNKVVWPACKQTIDDGGPHADADACQSMSTYYGPPPCQDDDDCAKSGTGHWYCDKTHYYQDGCGKKVYWAVCKQSIDDGGPGKDVAEPLTYYGPQVCSGDPNCGR